MGVKMVATLSIQVRLREDGYCKAELSTGRTAPTRKQLELLIGQALSVTTHALLETVSPGHRQRTNVDIVPVNYIGGSNA